MSKKVIISIVVLLILGIGLLIIFINPIRATINAQLWSKDKSTIEKYTLTLGSFQFPEGYNPIAGYQYQEDRTLIYKNSNGNHIFIESVTLSGLTDEYTKDIREGWSNAYYTYYFSNAREMKTATMKINEKDVELESRKVIDNNHTEVFQKIALVDTKKGKLLVIFTCEPAYCKDEEITKFFTSIK